jgi:aminobenzoyl-glutamate transport protein
MIASTFLCAAVIGLVCNLIVDKRFGEYVPGEDVEVPQLEAVSPEEKKALGAAGIAALIYLVIVLIGYFVGPLAKINEDGSRAFVGSPLLKGLIPILFFFFSIPGIVYGFKL